MYHNDVVSFWKIFERSLPGTVCFSAEILWRHRCFLLRSCALLVGSGCRRFFRVRHCIPEVRNRQNHRRFGDAGKRTWSALLCSEEEYSQQDLSELLYLPKQTVNSIISNLVKKGFVFLEHVPGTKNRKVVRLTKEGKDYGKQKVMWIFQAEEKALERMATAIPLALDGG